MLLLRLKNYTIMSTGLLHLHSFLPYIILTLLLLVVILCIKTISSGKLSAFHFKIARIAMILAHIQLLVGFMVLFMGDAAKSAFSQGMGEIMKNAELRNTFIEHPMMMLIGIALITIGFSRAKRAETDKAKNKNLLIFFGLGLVVILSKIPFEQWLNS